MGIELTALHYIYLFFILAILVVIVLKRDTTLVCIAGIFLLGLLATGSFSAAVSGIFSSFLYAIKQLLGTILVISVIVAMSKVLTRTGINEEMIRPFARLIRTPGLAFWTIGGVMFVVSLFFWPTPAVALMGIVLLPAALRVGLPAVGVAMAMTLFGHGIALSGDYVIQGAPKLTADAAGIPVSDVLQASIPLVLVMGTVTTIIAYVLLRRDIKKGRFSLKKDWEKLKENDDGNEANDKGLSRPVKKIFAAVVALGFLADVVAMFLFDLQGQEATALIGGTAVFLLMALSLIAHKDRGLEKSTADLIAGFQFGFKVFGPVIPIAAFFYLGDAAFREIFENSALPASSVGIVNDLGLALASGVPINEQIAAVTLTVIGAITGLDGSGFSGISLAGSIANLFAEAIGNGIATLTALGQIAAIWVGGGTLVPWALIPAAAICNVDPFDVARRNLVPVLIGLLVTTIFSMFLI